MKALAANWPPAIVAAAELELIAKYGSSAPPPEAPGNLIIFVDKMRGILATPGEQAVPRNRAERRRKSAKLARFDRRVAEPTAFSA